MLGWNVAHSCRSFVYRAFRHTICLTFTDRALSSAIHSGQLLLDPLNLLLGLADLEAELVQVIPIFLGPCSWFDFGTGLVGEVVAQSLIVSLLERHRHLLFHLA